MFEECLYFNSNALARTVTRLWSEAYKPFGLSPPHAFVLRVVLAKPGLLAMELAEELSLSRSTVTRFLDSLEARGFLLRKASSSDGRELQIHPTKKARDLHSALDKTGADLTRQIRERLGKEATMQTVSSLRKFTQQLNKT